MFLVLKQIIFFQIDKINQNYHNVLSNHLHTMVRKMVRLYFKVIVNQSLQHSKGTK